MLYIEISKEEDAQKHEEQSEGQEGAEVLDSKGKGVTLDKDSIDAEDDDDDDDFSGEEDDEDDDGDDDDDDDNDIAGSEEEAEDLEDAPGPSQGKPKRQKVDDTDNAEIIAGLSGDDVDPSNIIQGGRGARRGRYAAGASGSGGAKYSAKIEMASDEDSW